MQYNLRVNHSKDVLDYSNNLTWNSSASTLGATLSFDSLVDIPMGAVISLIIDGIEAFRGTVVTCDDYEYYYTYNVCDYAFYLKNEVTTQFNKINASTGLGTLLRQYDISSNIVNIPTTIDEIFTDETLESIINKVLETCTNEQGKDYYKEFIANQLYISELSTSTISPKIMIPKTIDINWSNENRKNIVYVESKQENESVVKAVANNPYSSGRYGKLQIIESDKEKLTQQQAQNLADNMLKQLDVCTLKATIEVIVLDKAYDLRANRLIFINHKRINKWVKINSVTHTLVKGVHKANLELEWSV